MTDYINVVCCKMYLYAHATPDPPITQHLGRGMWQLEAMQCVLVKCNALQLQGFLAKRRRTKAALQRLFIGSRIKRTPTFAVVFLPLLLLLLLLFLLLFTLNKQSRQNKNWL
jgi:hypothetical protein